ncbi:hypothetical protein FAM14222p2_001718 [Propionibacterium freudenreichii]|nr:hypothetical protein [Propionibacterium freudenreichii]
MTHRVGAINAVRHDRDRVATGCQGRSMGSSFDAVRTARNHDPLSVGEVGSQFSGHVLAVGRRGPGAGDRDKLAERSRQERGSATSPQDVWSPITKIVERGRPILVARDQHSDTHALGFDDALGVCLSVRTLELGAPDPCVNGAEARHAIVTLGEPEHLNRSHLAQETACHGVVWFDDHRQRHSCRALALCYLAQVRHRRLLSLAQRGTRGDAETGGFRERRPRRKVEDEAGSPHIAGPPGRPSGTHTRSASSTEKHV